MTQNITCSYNSAVLLVGGPKLQINVAQLLKEAAGASRNFEFKNLEISFPEYDLFVITPVSGKARLVKTNRGIYVEAEFYASVKLTCSRCLVEFSEPVSVKFREEFLPTIDIKTGLAINSGISDAFLINEHHIIDLGETYRQYLLMNLPLKPLCNESCSGICVECGTNLNQDACNCMQKEIDSRLSILKSLLSDDQEDIH